MVLLSPWEIELDCAKAAAQTAAQRIFRLPTGKVLLKDEEYNASARDPAYWRRKKKAHKACCAKEHQKAEVERAKRSAESAAQDLATFPAGKAFLYGEDFKIDHGNPADPQHWRSKEKSRKAEYRKLKQEY
ncbi:MAG: hypothetical protein Q9164_006554 [Protoblastenia rupestris]